MPFILAHGCDSLGPAHRPNHLSPAHGPNRLSPAHGPNRLSPAHGRGPLGLAHGVVRSAADDHYRRFGWEFHSVALQDHAGLGGQ
jgi:hypothetical protein